MKKNQVCLSQQLVLVEGPTYRLFHEFLDNKNVKVAGEAGGKGLKTGKHASYLSRKTRSVAWK